LIELDEIVLDFASAVAAADSKCPVAINARSKKAFQPGIGPHSESRTVELVTEEMQSAKPVVYRGRLILGVSYPDAPKQKCDFCVGTGSPWIWAVEVKMLRILGDNGKANDNILMHILSPYAEHRSAVTDCIKLSRSSIASRKAVLIFGYDAADWPLLPAIEAFEALASRRYQLGDRNEARFSGLVHPVHASGSVFAWELRGNRAGTPG